MIKITNDTSTLDGSLLEMKDQLIYELGEQGVTASYDSSTGLLGLIHKISEIISVPPTLTLTSNKNVLSYYDSETATLTATHSLGAGKSISVYNAVSGAKIGDMTDNNDGTYSYTYSSTGVGDISMTCATASLESNSITIEDCYFFDDFVSANNHYTAIRSSPTFENSIAIFPKTGSSQSYYILDAPLNFEYELEVGFVYNNTNYSYRLAHFDAQNSKTDDGLTYSNNEHHFWGYEGDIYDDVSSGGIFKYKVYSDKLEFYINNVLKYSTVSTTVLNNVYNKKIGFNHDNNISMNIDYIKIKQL